MFVCMLSLGVFVWCFLLFFFFFSSRRRHTRSLRDWSSDVCSSDLATRESPANSWAEMSPAFSRRRSALMARWFRETTLPLFFPWVYTRSGRAFIDRKSTRLNSSHVEISYAVFCLKKKKRHPALQRV